MPINSRELLDCVNILLDQEDMKVTIKETGKGTLVCATACFVGGLFGGPIGLAVGGTLGGITAAMLTKDKFRPVSDIIKNDLTQEQRELLAQKIMFVISDFHPADVAALLAIFANTPSVQKAVLQTAVGFLTNEMKLQIID